ncbi:MAG TPA: Rieske 2Fe-2S domain-containing protein [Solirubrobacteraceae bacterium]|nr:Rieske 2Fe-2S domain-containing protein [Solirubrobacteraceae bacterium]
MNQLMKAFAWQVIEKFRAATLWLLRIEPGELREASGEQLEDGTDPQERNSRRLPRDARAELALAGLLVASGAFGVVFIVLYALDDNNQFLGLSLGLSLMAAAAALILAGKRVTPQEQLVEERPELVHEADARDSEKLLSEGGEGISRRRLITGAAAVTGLGLGGALLVPIASSGPNVGDAIDDTPWHRGRPVVDVNGNPILASDIVEKTFVTGFPQGANPEMLASPIVIVKVPLEQLHLPDRRAADVWAPQGIVAYSKICTHAGCAIALYRNPLFSPHEPRPALVCPCHYSTFDPARGAEVIFGPAGRSLPQLPLAIDPATGALVANGGYSGSVGPAWFNTNRGSSA